MDPAAPSRHKIDADASPNLRASGARSQEERFPATLVGKDKQKTGAL